MTSLAASSSVSLLPPVALAHTYNSSGRLGMFVNPSACSCQTCVDYMGAESSSPAALGPSETNPSWAQGAWAYALPPSAPVSLTRSSSAMEGWGGEERPLFGADLRAAPALGRTVTGLGYAPSVVPEASQESDEEQADGAASAAPVYNRAALPGLGSVTDEEESVLVRLSNLRRSYKERQDAVYSEAYRSHDEAAAQDAEWEELDNKIDAIETLLRLFGVVLRDA
jgi:hypothetical protein